MLELTKPSIWWSAAFLAGSLFALSSQSIGQDHSNHQTMMEELVVQGQEQHLNTGTGDASRLLRTQGVDFANAGGISSLPILRGMNDDRIKLLLDGAELTAACANHMNPALSYMDASRVSLTQVLAGTTPVSLGGDSIAGTILIQSEQPAYAESNQGFRTSGSIGYFGRSNNDSNGVAINYSVATERASLTYGGAFDEAASYLAGDGGRVNDTLYRSENHALTLGLQGSDQSLLVKASRQEVPYQGFPNQYMDMIDNQSTGLILQYARKFAWGDLDAQIDWQGVDHEMGFFTSEKPGTMPMNTEGRDLGYDLAVDMPFRAGSLRFGHEFHRFQTDDWWPAVAGSMMMGPNDYINIDDGERTRFAYYLETEQLLSAKWHGELGVRYERVVMDVGEAQPYNTMPGMMGMNMDAMAASDFNAQDHRRNDDNIDLTAVLHHAFTDRFTLEFGYARKTRSPNLYERYSWGRGTMAMTMIGWFGDANGYVGDIDLDPEAAHTLSAAISWRDESRTGELTATSYYTRVNNYIDARQIGTFNPRMAMQVTRPLLQFTNMDAVIYGIDIQGSSSLFSGLEQNLRLNGKLSYTRGERRNDGGDLYRIMPLNIQLGLEHSYKNWSNTLQLSWVDRKKHADPVRLESPTSSYVLLDVETTYQWSKLTLSLGIRNLFDRQYELPLGGVNLAGWMADGMTGQFGNLPGEGRSVDVSIRYGF